MPRKLQPTERERLMNDLRTLVEAIPQETQGDITYYASDRLWKFIDAHANQTDYFTDE